MTPLKILICGGGCAGPALALFLARSGHQVVIVERFPILRAQGAQVDLRAQGIETVRRMGLLQTIRDACVDEEGTCCVSARGQVFATLMANTSGQGAQTMTSEYEIMRGDMVRTLYDATKDNVQYIFGKTVDHFEQDGNEVTVHFSDNTSDNFDLLVGADGQSSRIRKAILPPNGPDPYRRMGIYIAYFFVPRRKTDNNMMNVYFCPGRRLMFRRSSESSETGVYLMFRDDSPELHSISRASVEQQKEFFAQRFRGAGWETDRFLQEMKTADDFFCHECVQIRTDTWHKDRVVLLGDAGYCPSPFTGMGTTTGLVGAYVLAGEISRNPDNLPLALENYDKTLRPFVHEVQKINPTYIRWFMPESRWAVTILQGIVWLLCLLRIPSILARFAPEEEGGWKLPDYPGLYSVV